jgi:hypothetical protein
MTVRDSGLELQTEGKNDFTGGAKSIPVVARFLSQEDLHQEEKVTHSLAAIPKIWICMIILNISK